MSAQNDPAKNAPLGVNLPPINDEAKRYLVALTWSFRQARESFEMMTVFTIPSPKSAAVMVEDAEKLLESAKKMLLAITPKEVETGFNANKGNCHYQSMLHEYLKKTGKPVQAMTIAEVLAIGDEVAKKYNALFGE